MRQPIKLLTLESCENLLTFQSNDELRKKYKEQSYDGANLKFLKIQAHYLIDEGLTLGTTPKDDCNNSIEIYKQLSSLDKVQANDKRLWVSLTHTRFYNYVWQRWNIGSEKTSDSKIIDRMHFEGAGINSRMGNAISRLWWTAKVTYDKTRSDEFELTRLIWEKQDIQVALMERSFSTYPNVVQGVLEFSQQNKHLIGGDWQTLLRGLNALGGVKVLPMLKKHDVVNDLKRIADFSKISYA